MFIEGLIVGGTSFRAHSFLLKHLAHPFTNFYRRRQKVRNLVSVFDSTRLWAIRVSRGARYLKYTWWAPMTSLYPGPPLIWYS